MTATLPTLPTLFCIDDDEGIVDQLAMVFRNMFQVTTVTDPTEAVARLLAGQKFDLIICDQQMPGLTGTHVLEIARETNPDGGRILLTGFCTADAVFESVNNAGVDWYISKPWGLKDIREKALQAARPSIVERESDFTGVDSAGAVAASDALAVAALAKTTMPSVVCVGTLGVDHNAVRAELGMTALVSFLPTFDEAIAQFERRVEIPDVMVVAIDVEDPKEHAKLSQLKATLPSVVLVIVLDTTIARDAMLLINDAKPYRFLGAPAALRLLGRAVAAGITRAAELRSRPALLAAQLPQPPIAVSTFSAPIGARLKQLVVALRGRILARSH